MCFFCTGCPEFRLQHKHIKDGSFCGTSVFAKTFNEFQEYVTRSSWGTAFIVFGLSEVEVPYIGMWIVESVELFPLYFRNK